MVSAERYMTYPGSPRAANYATVESVTAPGPYTVVFHLSSRDSTSPATRRFISPASWPSSATTSGPTLFASVPFMFDHRVVGDNVTLIKSPYYYDRRTSTSTRSSTS